MSKQKHTPGPWEVYIDGTRPGIEAPDASLSIVIFGDKGDDGGVRGRGKPEAFANARLIASAPDMLAALIEIAKPAPVGCNPELLRKIARAAIAKATGGGK